MKTKNLKLLNPKENKKYYSQSDKNYMPFDKCTVAHKVLDRIAWARGWIYNLGCRNLIDTGCKDGYLCLTLGAEGIECVGIDPSTDAIDEAQVRARELDLDYIVTFLEGFAEQVPEGIKADVVTCLEVIEHVIDADVLLSKLASMGSYFLISTPDANGRHGLLDSERNEEHVRLFTKTELEELISKYGVILESVIRDDQLCVIAKSNKF